MDVTRRGYLRLTIIKMRRNKDRLFFVVLVLILGTLMLLLTGRRSHDTNNTRSSQGRDLPLIFISGIPGSGTTLMRAILDAHHDVRCRVDTRVIPAFLQYHPYWLESIGDILKTAGITKDLLDKAMAAFCLELIQSHSEAASRLCYKDPILLHKGIYMNEVFPNSKFLLVVRDGRAAVHSIISRKVEVPGYTWSSYQQNLKKWNRDVELMYTQCKILGPDKCMLVHYESLVLNLEKTLRNVMVFLQLPWDDAMLHHEQYINQPHGISLTNAEKSSQVAHPVNREAVTKWVDQMPADMSADMADLAPMLILLGYNQTANPPRYETLPHLTIL